jgi:transcriptional regulator GlxA family with amidase domain
MTRRIAFLIYPGFQLLDAAGPIAAFEIAARYKPGSYDLRVIAAETGLVPSSAGVSMPAARFAPALAVDTLLLSAKEHVDLFRRARSRRGERRACAREPTCLRQQVCLTANPQQPTGAVRSISAVASRKCASMLTAFL